MSIVPQSAWRVSGASARGTTHVRNGAPNQDAWLCLPGPAPTVISVSDGHGAAVHFRSQTGAEIAVRAAAEVLQAQIDDCDGADLAHNTLMRWRKGVRAHMAEHPFSIAEQKLSAPPPLAAYGATLIAGAVNSGVLTVLQIGDGDLLLGYPDGRLERPFQPGPALAGELTFSLCQEDALTWIQSAMFWRAHETSWPNFIFMATDGVSKSFQDNRTFEAEVARLRGFATADWDAFVNEAPTWLSTLSSKGSGDDATMCVAMRTAPRQELDA
jgi:hypothetical protein